MATVAVSAMAQDTLPKFDSVRLEGVTVVGARIIKQKEIKNYSELAGSSIETAKILNNIPGVFMHNGTYTTNRITIRGIGSRSPYSSNRVKAYLGEIPLTDGSGNTVIEDLPLNLFTSELINGPSSSIYGAGLGGAILLRQKKANMLNRLELITEMSSYRTFLNSLIVRQVKSNWDVELAYTGLSNGGYRDNNVTKRNNAMLLFNHQKGSNKFNAMINMVDLKSEIPSSLDSTDFNDEPSLAAAKWAAVNGYEHYTKIMSGLSLTTDIGKNSEYSGSVFLNYFDQDETRFFNILEDNATTYGFRNKIVFEKNNIYLNLGSEWFFEVYNYKIYGIEDGERTDLLNRNRQNRDYSNLFGRIKIDSLLGALQLDASLNLNTVRFVLQDQFEADSVDQSGIYRYATIYSPGVSLSYPIKKTTIYTSLNHGFSTPSFEETLLPDGNFNTELKPEDGYELEFGFKGRVGEKFKFQLAAYQIWLNNQLVTQRLSDSEFMTINAGKSELKGIELNAELKDLEVKSIKTKLSPFVSGNFSENKFIEFEDDEVVYDDKNLPGIPSYKVNVGLKADVLDNYYCIADFQMVGDQWLDDANTLDYGSYNLLNFKIGYKNENGKRILNAYAGINNLLDVRYASMLLINAPGKWSAPRYYYPGLPRNFYIGLNLTFK
ncbi:MAG: TonB-dependent receptor plug domain-containing protein [Flavobacteriales bacterium]|nr:TonB-dependent receptor plug domain-containing protein [Flavobacteriales bacterium]